MKKNIGILFSSSRKMGVFQYGLAITEALANYCDEFEYTILYFGDESPADFLKVRNPGPLRYIALDAAGNTLMGKIKLAANCLLGRPMFPGNKKNRDALSRVHIDLLIIPFQLMFGFEHNIPYIVGIPDVMYKYYPQFPEYSFKNRIISDVIFTYSTKYAVLSIVDSRRGAEDVRHFFHVPREKIRAIPYLPAGYVFAYKDMDKETAGRLLEKYHLPEKFVFYPAQFWAHKNHLNLIKAIGVAEKKYGQKIPLVLVGNDKANSENYQKIMGLAKELGVDGGVLHLGYVTDEEIVALYKKSTALVFASVGGPTNIPLVEAMFLGTPVIFPNLFAMPEQVGDAGVAFNPFDPDDMAEKISQVWQDDALRQRMVKKGYEKIKGFTLQRYADMWISAVKSALAYIT